MTRRALWLALIVVGLVWTWTTASQPTCAAADGPPLPGTERLDMSGDIASALVDGCDRFLLRKLDESVASRASFWQRDASSPEKYTASVEPNRQRLMHIAGVRDPRVALATPEFVSTLNAPGIVGVGAGYSVFAVRWPTFGDVYGEGLLLVPSGQSLADVVALPDADQTPEMLVGLTPGIPPESQYARRLAESGCRVLVPVLVSREVQKYRSARLTNREFIYRAAFELGQHVIGYEVQKILAAVDWFDGQRRESSGRKLGLIGWGEGGELALYAAAIDPRISAACVSGDFDSRQDVWQQPVERNVFGLLEQFGDAELATLIAPRTLIVEAARGPEVVVPPGTGGAPGRLAAPPRAQVEAEVARAKKLVSNERLAAAIRLVVSGDGSGPNGSPAALGPLLTALSPRAKLAPLGGAPKDIRSSFDPGVRQARAVYELNRHSQRLLQESAEVRKNYFAKLDISSLEKFQKTIGPYRMEFYEDVIGHFHDPVLPPHPRSRLAYDRPKFLGYEVVLDVFPDVMAYGILLVPKDIPAGQRRPVVVCQHGLEGRPQDVVEGDKKAFHYYQDFATKLADEGFVTFAPQNLYLFGDRFRSLQRKANPLGKTLYSLIVPQHQQILDWLGTLSFVDENRIAFYGLSYGGKTAMRVPALVTNYCLSICSGDFNEWIWKNVSVGNNYSYMGTGEYEIFEFDLGNRFNYSEMAALIAPRPFMVERGRFDGVAPDEQVGFEYAKVRYLYEAKLGIGDRTTIEWFNGPHMIHGLGTFEFLRKWLGRGPG